MPSLKLLFLFIVPLAVSTCLAEELVSAPETFVYHHEHVLGTSLEIQVQADSEQTAQAAETQILNEIQRLNKIFSTYDSASEFSRWQREPKMSMRVSPELYEMLAASERWHRLSSGAFQPGIDAMSRLWRNAEKSSVAPSRERLDEVVSQVNQPHWRLDGATKSVVRLTDCPLTLNAIAKGAIVEWACLAAVQTNNVQGLIINLGGDMRVYGDAVQQIEIADPHSDAVNSPPLETIFVTNRAVATSGGYRRGFRIDGQWYSHILDPRNGRPVNDVVSATIVARSSADADALATICNVLPIAESLELIDSLDDVQCLLVTSNGTQYRSVGWNELTAPRPYRLMSSPAQLIALADTDVAKADVKDAKGDEKEANATVTPELLELLVKFELDRPAGAQYRRPYVAVWLEDEDEYPVKTGVLWMQTKTPGPRWHRDLLRWYRNDGVRKLADGTQLIGTISAATRGPGEYKVAFDGLDDSGKPLKPGKYTLFLEVAREHGTYQLIRHPLNLNQEPIPEKKLKGNVEIKSASVEYRVRDVKPAEANAK